MKFGLQQQIMAGLILVVVAYILELISGNQILVHIAWTLMGASFIIHPVLPKRLPESWRNNRWIVLWSGKTGKLTIRVLGALIIIGGWAFR